MAPSLEGGHALRAAPSDDNISSDGLEFLGDGLNYTNCALVLQRSPTHSFLEQGLLAEKLNASMLIVLDFERHDGRDPAMGLRLSGGRVDRTERTAGRVLSFWAGCYTRTAGQSSTSNQCVYNQYV